MLVHRGGKINNVQLITGLRIAEMSQLFFFFFLGGGGGFRLGGGGGVRVDVN